MPWAFPAIRVRSRADRWATRHEGKMAFPQWAHFGNRMWCSLISSLPSSLLVADGPVQRPQFLRHGDLREGVQLLVGIAVKEDFERVQVVLAHLVDQSVSSSISSHSANSSSVGNTGSPSASIARNSSSVGSGRSSR